jgi:alkanesulfonate monooxygenase SsuD/methylene tetrahydromethanopterin reductase-like flavin-dependent oxidoreductase (luciferase family)
MDVGVTLPNGALGIPGPKLVEWGVRAEQLGFAVAGVIGRTAYPTHEELITLAAVAGATSRIRLMPTVMVGPTREPVLLAKQCATLDRISGGRFILGIGSGMRDDDFTVTGTDYAGRGKRLDEMLDVMHKVWRGEALTDDSREATPPPTNGDRIPIMFGANIATKPVIRRIARWGDGFIAAGSPQMVKPIVDGVQDEWDRLGRQGRPKLVAASYFTFGADDEAEANIRDYYEFIPMFGEMAISAMVRDPKVGKRYLDHYADAGFDEFLFSAASTDPDQLERLAEAVL